MNEGAEVHVDHMEPQSTTGKWILLILAAIFVAAAVFG